MLGKPQGLALPLPLLRFSNPSGGENSLSSILRKCHWLNRAPDIGEGGSWIFCSTPEMEIWTSEHDFYFRIQDNEVG